MTSTNEQLIDRFGRRVDYVRVSVTDRCDFRCVYCMSEEMTFLPRQQILTLEEQFQVCEAFTQLGVKKVRITGGEPLVRHNIQFLFDQLGKLSGLDELLLTTNGSQLDKFAQPLKDAGVNRINISLDSLNADKFKELTRTGDLKQVLKGIEAAKAAGFERVKINSVILKGRNDDEILPLVNFARDMELDISFIEEMPLGGITEHDRAESFCPSDEIRETISEAFPLSELDVKTGGPSRYFRMADSASRVGFISPHSHNFCSTCNRVRVTAEGRLLLCLGNEHSMDLRAVLRQHPGDSQVLQEALIKAMDLKPERHYFDLNEEPQIVRFMNMTGG